MSKVRITHPDSRPELNLDEEEEEERIETLEDAEIAGANHRAERGGLARTYAYATPQSGLLGSPGRAMALFGSLGMLLVVFMVIIWLLSTRNTGAGTVSGGNPDTGNLPVAPVIEALAPNFRLIDVRNNRTLQLSDLRGKPVFVNFWGTWCQPCRVEMPEMQKIYDQYKDQVEIVGISMGPRDTPESVRQFLNENHYGWTFIHDPDYAVATEYRIQAIPTSFFIDRNGVIKAMNIGPMDTATIQGYLSKIR